MHGLLAERRAGWLSGQDPAPVDAAAGVGRVIDCLVPGGVAASWWEPL
jgi:hypothetical protein